MLAERDGANVTLVESDTRKAAFLARWPGARGRPVDIRPGESKKPRLKLSLALSTSITARALAPLPRLLELAAPGFSGLTPSGCF